MLTSDMRRIWSCAGNELLDVVLAYIYLLAYTLPTYLPLLASIVLLLSVCSFRRRRLLFSPTANLA